MIQIALIVLLCSMTFMNADNHCGENESISLCGTMCEPTCENPHPKVELCPRIQCANITRGCRCDEGYLRNQQKMCVSPDDCDCDQIS